MQYRKLVRVVLALAAGGLLLGVLPATDSVAGYENPNAFDHEDILANALASTGSCGVERWSVKTGTDADASLIDLSSTTQTTIASLISLPTPSSLPSNNRIIPTEITVFQVSATLVEFKMETDSDYHLVLADGSGDTMIAEIPDPACVGSTSPLLPGIKNARAEFDAKYNTTTSWHTANTPVTIRGVGFFDYLHGQTGVAPNGIELHPVLNISFGTSGGNTVTVTNPGSQSGTVGTATSLQIQASDSASGQTLTYSATGLPPGLAISSSTGLISGTPTTAGTYNVTATAADTTGAAGSASFTWTVTSCSSGGQLLGNPGFETGSAAPWNATAGVINSSTSEPPHSGSWDAWLDGYGTSHTDTLSQSVTLPSGCTTYSFSFWLHVDTAETTTTSAYDTLRVQVLDSSGNLLATLATYSNLNHNTGYAQHTFSLAPYAGRSVTLLFSGTEDYTLQTSFVIDDTSLNVS